MEAYLHFGTGNEPRQTIKVDVIEAPLAFHKLGLSYTATGYGARIPTIYLVQWQGRWRRVYAACYSNCASLYIGKPGNWLATISVER